MAQGTVMPDDNAREVVTAPPGYDPEKQPLVMAFGKDGRKTKVWWKGEEISELLAVHVDGRTPKVKLCFGRIGGSLACPGPISFEDRIARQQKVMDEAKEAGFTVLLEQ